MTTAARQDTVREVPLQKEIDNAIAQLVRLRQHDACKRLMVHTARPATHFNDVADFAEQLAAAVDPIFQQAACETGLDYEEEFAGLVSQSNALDDFAFTLRREAEQYEPATHDAPYSTLNHAQQGIGR